ncbi:site-specific integrase [Endozoicomonas sp.]|uniref:site-specific integrase n=1 Tax=Endozoicomonas sp. TaxID=1892382 RepID=UPI00383BB9AA
METKTKQEYISLANHFIKTKFDDASQVTPQKLIDALIDCRYDYRPAYWRRLRRALTIQQEDLGYKKSSEKISKTKNPATKKGSDKSLIKPKQKRVKKIKPDDEKIIIGHLKSIHDEHSLAALYLTKYMGVRPAEMSAIRVSGNKVFINGAKISHGGKRGLDRELLINDKQVRSLLEWAAKQLSGKTERQIENIQERVSRASKRCFPKRKIHYSLYSWRHQFGSNLKASNLDRIEAAQIMGHQSTKSLNSYGNRRTSNGGLYVEAFRVKADLIREKHTEIEDIKPLKPDPLEKLANKLGKTSANRGFGYNNNGYNT